MVNAIQAPAPAAAVRAVQANRFAYIKLNMGYTLDAWNGEPQNPMVRVAHIVAKVTLIPFLLLASIEAVVKNGCFLIANAGIAIANTACSLVGRVKLPPPAAAAIIPQAPAAAVPPPVVVAPQQQAPVAVVRPEVVEPPTAAPPPAVDALPPVADVVQQEEEAPPPPVADAELPQEVVPDGRQSPAVDAPPPSREATPPPQARESMMRRVAGLARRFWGVLDDLAEPGKL